ncbi:alpha/beta hydrolase [Rhodococcus spelaei]|uniref:Alpha/beta hydrolase n=1 Tax=Rhodococcus spelaei TaxID=2546320 RepID=A0A541BPD5_9NOCA|nr:alpha/beta fold hydrolase [Rhodococcus spelaei]TQF74175.1 alpha/beta hydrolase [Rhodococcus spelaei]
MLDFDWRPRLTTITRNAWGLTFGGGVEPAERTPSERLHSGHHRDLYRFGVERRRDARPVLLVPPLAVSATCYDLRPGQSMAAHLLGQGHATYLVDYGTMTADDRRMGFEAWVDDILPESIRRVSDLHDGAPVDLVGWSLGGTMSLLTAAAHADLPIRSVTAVGTPVDYTRIPTIAPLRAVGAVTSERPLTAATWALGGLPAPVVQASYRATALQRELLRPWFIARNLHDTESLARMESIDRFMASMPGYPARFFHQLCQQLILGNALAAGQFRLGDRVVELSEISVPVLAVGGTTDVLAPAASVQALVPLLTGSPSVRFEGVPGSHLGLVAGPGAKDTTWRFLDEFLVDPIPAI